MLKRLREWWNRPLARERIFAAMSKTEWRAPLDIIAAAKVSVGSFYSQAMELERDGVFESKWDEGPIPASRNGRRRRLYRLK